MAGSSDRNSSEIASSAHESARPARWTAWCNGCGRAHSVEESVRKFDAHVFAIREHVKFSAVLNAEFDGPQLLGSIGKPSIQWRNDDELMRLI